MSRFSSLFILLLLLCFSYNINAQPTFPLLVDEDFNNNTYGWDVSSDKYQTSYIRHGVFTFILKTDEYLYRFWNELFNTFELKDYVLEVKLRQVNGKYGSYFGILWDSYGSDQTNEFLISSDGYYKIRTKDGEDADFRVIVPDTKTSVINTIGKWNILSVYRHGWYYDFYINGYQVARVKIPTLGVKGKQVGMVITDPMRVDYDYFKIYGNQREFISVEKPIKARKINLGPAINTKDEELSPLITADGKTLYFIRRADADTSTDKIYVSHFINGSWTRAKKMPAPFNNENNNAINYVSADGNLFIITGRYERGKLISTNGISMIYRKKDGTFSEPKQILISDYINTWEYYGYTFSPDRNVMIMSVSRPGDCFGKSDLYVSFLQPDGNYSTPINLGPDINTPAEEGTPFLAPDGQTLYFSSAGFPGFGSRDIFVSRRLDDTWQHWSTPQNLGPYINSEGWDAYFTIDASGKYAYLVSSENSIGNEDIFMIPLSTAARPRPVAEIHGKVTDSLTGEPVYASIYYSKTMGDLKDYSLTDGTTGDYKLVLPVGNEFYITAVAKGYFNTTKKVVLPDVDSVISLNLDIKMQPISVGQKFVLSNIYFPAGSANILQKSYPALEGLVNFMKHNPNVKIEVSGHTNNIGDFQRLVELSLKRANAVKNYLIKNGIDASRIKTVGYGPSRPIADNSTLAGRRKNQRVEVKIISN